METGYDPHRLRALGERTADAIRALHAIRSTDHAASEAMRAIRLARRNLEDLWMPAILQIQRSDAMVSWIARAPATTTGRSFDPMALPDHLSSAHRPLASLSVDELLDLVDVIDRLLADAPTDGVRIDTFSIDTLPARYDPAVLATELAIRVHLDPPFRQRLVELAPTSLVVGHVLARAEFPATFVAEVVTAMAGSVSGRSSTAPDGFASAFSAALSVLIDQPDIALDLLLDGPLLLPIATSSRLDADIVGPFVISALDWAAVDRPADGYRLIERVTDLTEAQLATGMNEGFALGLAGGLDSYLDDLAGAIGQRSDDISIRGSNIGSYANMRELLGAILRHDTAAIALGARMGDYTARTIDALGADLGEPGTFGPLGRLVALVDEAAVEEQTQLIMEAGAEERRRRAFGNAVNLGARATLTATGVGTAARGFTSWVIELGTDVVADVEPEQLAGASLGSQLYHQVSLGTLRAAIERPSVTAGYPGTAMTASERQAVERRLDEIEACGWGETCGVDDDPSDHKTTDSSEARSVLEQRIGRNSRVMRFVDHVRSHPEIAALR